jgi:hypothetical protein
VKAAYTEKVFTPITITLETEGELIALAAVLRHLPISKAVGFASQWECLERFRVDDIPAFHEAFKRLDAIWDRSVKGGAQ